MGPEGFGASSPTGAAAARELDRGAGLPRDPEASRALDVRDGVAEELAELWTRDGPQRGDESRGHDGDEHPAGDVAAIPRTGDAPGHGGRECRSCAGLPGDEAVHSLSPCVVVRWWDIRGAGCQSLRWRKLSPG